MKKYNLLLRTLIVLVIALGGVRLVVSNSLSTSGIALDRINEKITQYKLDNDILSEKLFSLSSLNTIASEAAKMGFVYKTDKYFFTTPGALAAKQ